MDKATKIKKFSRLALLLILLSIGCVYFNSNNSAIPNEIKLYGNVDIRQVSLAFENAERIKSVNVEEGNRVKKGDILATLEVDTLKLQIKQAKASVKATKQAYLKLKNGSRPEEIEQAKAQLASALASVDLATLDMNRLDKLSANTSGRGVSKQDMDNATAQLKVAKAKQYEASKTLELAEIGPRIEDINKAEAELNMAKAKLALLKHKLELSELKAPQDAIVRSRLLEVGDMASPAKPVFALALTDPKWVRVYANETDLGHIKEGASASVWVDSFPNEPIEGQIGYISSVAEFTPKNVQTEDLRTSLVYEVRVIVKDPLNHLRLGMPATVKIKPDIH